MELINVLKFYSCSSYSPMFTIVFAHTKKSSKEADHMYIHKAKSDESDRNNRFVQENQF